MPQHRFASIHVVGTNGKTSVAEMSAALLEAHGVRTGAYLSPHDERWSERVRIGGAEIDADEFGAAVERVAQSAEAVNRALDEGEAVTQFEAVTAAAFVALAAAGIEVGVIEAGLGGRLDATNVLPSRVTALTSVGLEHTEWLGETEAEIAAEKLAVLRDHSTLVLGEVSAEVEELGERTARERTASVLRAEGMGPDVLTSHAPYLRRNFLVAMGCAEVLLGGGAGGGDGLDLERVTQVASHLELHGRMEVVEGDPTLILDSAHNPAGAAALAEALPAAIGADPVVACLAVLADKDAAGIVEALAPVVAAVVVTEIPPERLESVGRPGARSIEVGELERIATQAGIGVVEAGRDPAGAVSRTCELARERGTVALVCGSHYLLRYAIRDA
jgi:dihydrofolate synthase/folylpolyglutamate synthase